MLCSFPSSNNFHTETDASTAAVPTARTGTAVRTGAGAAFAARVSDIDEVSGTVSATVNGAVSGGENVSEGGVASGAATKDDRENTSVEREGGSASGTPNRTPA
jgi:hypothetical protein